MAKKKTKEEIIEEVKSAKDSVTVVSTFYTFDEGKIIELPKPKTNFDLETIICMILRSGQISENNMYLTSLLYYETFEDLDKDLAQRISGKVSLDENLFEEDNVQAAKTAASAAFDAEKELVCLRKNIFHGDEKKIAEDMICTLHECRHYFQHLTQKPYKKTFDGKVEGGYSEKEMLAIAYRLFNKDTLFPGMSKEEIAKYRFAMYYMIQDEIDAREYSLVKAAELVQAALSSPYLSQEETDKLSKIMAAIKEEMAETQKTMQEQIPVYKEIVSRMKNVAIEIQSKVPEILSEENIAKLEHYNERDEETESIRQFIFNLENSLWVNYDEKLAKLIQRIKEKYDVYAVGRNLVTHPQFTPSQKMIDAALTEDIGMLFGEPSICPPYDKEEAISRYAEIRVKQQG